MAEWNPTQFFRGANNPPAPFALVILNQPLNERAFEALNEYARFTICADGGANRFYEMMKNQGRETSTLPNAIIGDLDSITPAVRSHYTTLGVSIIEDPDQYSTDFTKCLKHIRQHISEITNGQDGLERLEIVILGGLGGRVDQAFSQIHHLYSISQHQSDDPRQGRLYLISEESVTFILSPGKNTINTPQTNRPGASCPESEYLLEENVGIIPLLGPARITIHGFEWDVENWRTEIGKQISTSNHIRGDVVEVEAEVPVLFTLELAGRFKRAR